MAALDEIGARLDELKNSGLIADYEIVVADDSVRLRVVAPDTQDIARVKSFVVETLAGLVSESQLRVETAEG